ncbi:MAG: hypothetical protein HYV34_03865 [Candidatus Kerfeldbacteria bacterium]|nr:hypothetical protein [Candidatus Kerfeldbacteria bacterium]
MMHDAIRDFSKQFEFEPVIQNKENWKKYGKFLVCGMGGSNLASELLKAWRPKLDIQTFRDYGLPAVVDPDRMIIASSYSGNTEETLSSFDEARQYSLPLVALSAGGKLKERALAQKIPYVEIPATGIQPRSALGFSFRALARLMGLEDAITESAHLATILKPNEIEPQGKKLAETLKDHVPVIYASLRNFAIAYNWKIKLNETGKIPAFYNLFPELNHNEMSGFDRKEKSEHLSERFSFLFLKDAEDRPEIKERVEVLELQLRDRHLPVTALNMNGERLEKMFNSLLLADWVAVHTAAIYGHEAEQVPMIEEFKKKITS